MDEFDPSQLDPTLRAKIDKGDWTSCRKIISMTEDEFQKVGSFTLDEIFKLKSLAARCLLPMGLVTANQAAIKYGRKWKSVPFGCPAIDKMLDGGVDFRGITEIFGESGSGKTQLCLQLSLAVQYPDVDGTVSTAVYICTEDKFPSQRLVQIATHLSQTENWSKFGIPFCDNVLVDHIADVDELKCCLFNRLPALLNRSRVGLIVLDSIAALFRADYSKEDSINRAEDLRIIGIELHRIARRHNICVICVNQVTDSIETCQTIPALGLAWANLVTTKLEVVPISTGKRRLKLVSSPRLPPSSCLFSINPTGISD